MNGVCGEYEKANDWAVGALGAVFVPAFALFIDVLTHLEWQGIASNR